MAAGEEGEHAYAGCVRGEGAALVRAWGEHAWAYGDDPVLCEGPGEAPETVRTVHASGAVRTWDERTGEIVAVVRLVSIDGVIERAVWSLDGARVFAWNGSGSIEGGVYDARTGGRIATCRLPDQDYETLEFMGHDEPVLDGFTLDGEHVVARGCLDREELRFRARWSTRTGQLVEWAAAPDVSRPAGLEPPYEDRYEASGGELRPRGEPDERDALVGLAACVLALSGALLATLGARSGVRVWDARTGAPRWLLEGAAAPVRAVAFSPDERSLYGLTAEHFVRWDLISGLLVDALPVCFDPLDYPPKREAVSMSVAPDGDSVVILGAAPGGFSDYARVAYCVAPWQLRWQNWATGGGPRTERLRGHSADGSRVWVEGDDGRFGYTLDPRTGRYVDEVESLSPELAEASQYTVAPGVGASRWVLVDGALWSVAPEQKFRIDTALNLCAPLVASGDGRWLLTGSASGDALVWRTAHGSEKPVFVNPVATLFLSSYFDRVRFASFDAREETLVLSTERGVLLTLALTA